MNREHLDAAPFQDGFTAGRAALEAGRYAEAAEGLREALGLWRSTVLADLADYAFTRPEAARLEELRLAALDARIDADLALGRHDALTGELEQQVAGHPLRERLHGQLMLALYRCGRRPMRSPPTGGSVISSPTKPASIPASRCGGCTDPFSPTTRRSTGPRDAKAHPAAARQRRNPVTSPAPRRPGLRRPRAAMSWAGGGGAPAACWHRLRARGRRGRVHRRGGPAVGGRANSPAGQQRGPDRPGWGTGRRTGERGQPGRSRLRRRLAVGRGWHRGHAYRGSTRRRIRWFSRSRSAPRRPR